MDQRLIIVGIAGLLVGTVIGGIWLSRDLPEVAPVATVASRGAVGDDVVAPGPAATRREGPDGKRPGRAPGEKARPASLNPGMRPEPGQGGASAGPSGEPRVPVAGGGPPSAADTGLPSPADILGLPGDDADDAALVAGLATEAPPLPERPLSHFEMETLEDRANWLNEACQSSSDPNCSVALSNMDQALQQARALRAEAGVDGEEDIAPPPMHPPPGEVPPEGEDGPPPPKDKGPAPGPPPR